LYAYDFVYDLLGGIYVHSCLPSVISNIPVMLVTKMK